MNTWWMPAARNNKYYIRMLNLRWWVCVKQACKKKTCKRKLKNPTQMVKVMYKTRHGRILSPSSPIVAKLCERRSSNMGFIMYACIQTGRKGTVWAYQSPHEILLNRSLMQPKGGNKRWEQRPCRGRWRRKWRRKRAGKERLSQRYDE